MKGKTLRVVENSLTFGTTARMVDVYGCFKYKTTNNMYLIYSDTDTKYNIIYYGSAHIKEKSLLCMQCRDIKEEEVIKEYIFKITNKESLDNFETISLEEVEEIEIIASTKLEIKKEILSSIKELTLPKKEETEENKENKQKKKGSKKFLLFLLLILIIGVGYLYLSKLPPKDAIVKEITCQKNYDHDVLKATVDETNIYYFNNQDNLESVGTTMIYQFSEEDYREFIMKGTYYKYMPDSDIDGGWDKDDESHLFKIMMKETIDTSYNKPTSYEEVLAYYKKEGYTCTEDIDKE